MSERPADLAFRRRVSLLQAVAVRVEQFLLEPAQPAAPREPAAAPRPYPVVAVVAVAPRCGVTTVARALAATLAVRHAEGVAAVAGAFRAGPPLAAPAARSLARRVESVAGGRARAAGRLCLCDGADAVALVAGVRAHAPVVLEVPYGSRPHELVSLADAVLVVSGPQSEPALAVLVAATIGRVGPPPLLVLNRGGWDEEASWDFVLPDSRPAARAAHAGYAPRGWLGRAVEDLAARIG